MRFKEETSSYRINSVFLLPGELLSLEAFDESGRRQFAFDVSVGRSRQNGRNKWEWSSPEKVGVYPLRVTQMESGETILLNAFVMVPYEKLEGEYFNGYRIGRYPSKLFRNLKIYEAPKGFIEVTRENEDLLLVPHFKLKQFLCKQAGDYPKYVVLRERLLFKLELLLERVNQKGWGVGTFSVMSGYRTPYYNKSIGNGTYSRHVWGGAADIFIDENPRDGMMDDLNLDGKIDLGDAGILREIADEMDGHPQYGYLVGGLARYRKNDSHGPFVHVDTRGFRARWND